MPCYDPAEMGKKRQDHKYEVKDAYYQKAKKEGYAARSAFKLEEIDHRQPIYQKGMKVLDLGCAPGSWLQYASHKVGEEGRLVGFDLDPVRVALPNVKTFVMDIFEINEEHESVKDLLPFDLIQSDAMTKTTGIPETDCARSIDLVEFSIHLAKKGFLKKGGTLLAKVFEGPGYPEFYKNFRSHFEKTQVYKPEAIRKGSREQYILGLGFKA